MATFGERFLQKMNQAKSKLKKAKLRDANGNPINIRYQDKKRLGTDDVYMIACHVTNKMSHNIYFVEDSRYIENPVRYLVKPNEKVVLPHIRMIVEDDFNSPEIKFDLSYGEEKGD